MKRIFCGFLITLLTFCLSADVVFAQNWQRGRNRGINSGMMGGVNDPSSRSFRKKLSINNPFVKQITGGGQSELLTRGQMMTEPSISSLAYQVHLLGEVKKPGTYRIMASERLAEALQRVGGVAEQGSERNIEIRRGGKVYKVVDIVKFKLYGNLANNPYLLDNDVIYVPLKSKTVQIVGAVKRPDEYELKGEKSLEDVVKLAGGFSAGVSASDPIKVIRFIDGKKSVLEINQTGSEMSMFKIINADVIYIPNIITAKHEFDYDIANLPGDTTFYPSFEDRIFVLGGVVSPGAYPFNPYYNMHQYISLAGGYTQLSTRKLRVIRPDGKKIRVRRNKPIKLNPGDTLLVGERRIPPEGWVNLFMSFAGFGLSTTATVLTLTR